MSVEAIKWAMWQQDVQEDPPARQVLFILANYANEQNDSFPSVGTIRALTHLGTRTIKDKLARLEEIGVIGQGNQSLAAAYMRNGQQPTVYRLNVRDVATGYKVAGEITAALDEAKKGLRKGQKLQGAAAQQRGAAAAPLVETRGAAPAEDGCGSCQTGVRDLPLTGAAAAHEAGIDPGNDPGSDTGKGSAPSKAKPAGLFGVEDLVALGVERQTALDWLVVRKQHKATNTFTALAGLQRNVEEVGCTIQAAVQLCAERSWRGFDASWPQAKALAPGAQAAGTAVPMPRRALKPSEMQPEQLEQLRQANMRAADNDHQHGGDVIEGETRFVDDLGGEAA